MKYGFSTLVCPDWRWKDILTAASDLGFDGIELRGIGKEIYLPKISLFQPEILPKTKQEIHRLGLLIPCLATGAFLFDYSLMESAQKEAKECIELAAAIGTPYIRLLADRDPAPGIVDEQAVVENLRALLPEAQKRGITLLVETNGIYAESKRLRALCDLVAHPSLGVLWDVHHPFRYFHESPAQTYANLSPFIRHIHVKDSVVADGRVAYRMIGYGDIPLADVMRTLREGGYDDFVVLEWVRRWNMSLEEPGIVLPQFLSAIRRMLA